MTSSGGARRALPPSGLSALGPLGTPPPAGSGLRGLAWLQLSDLGQVGTAAVTDDSGGGGTTVWSFGADVPCRIDPLGNDESVAASRLSDRSTNVVTVPAGTAVSATNRFAITGRGTFEITGVDDRTGELARFFEVVAVS